jgi:hypothetical protein
MIVENSCVQSVILFGSLIQATFVANDAQCSCELTRHISRCHVSVVFSVNPSEAITRKSPASILALAISGRNVHSNFEFNSFRSAGNVRKPRGTTAHLFLLCNLISTAFAVRGKCGSLVPRCLAGCAPLLPPPTSPLLASPAP